MENNQILKELNACAALCNICYNACLSEGDFSTMARCIALTSECADVCHLASSMLARNSENIEKYLKLSADISLECAKECEKHEFDFCYKCAQVCRKNAEMCYIIKQKKDYEKIPIS